MITIHQRYRQTDRRTDRRHAIPRPRICTKVHCAVKTLKSFLSLPTVQLFQRFEQSSCLIGSDNILNAKSDQPSLKSVTTHKIHSLKPKRTFPPLPLPPILSPPLPLPHLPSTSLIFHPLSFPSLPSLQFHPLRSRPIKSS